MNTWSDACPVSAVLTFAISVLEMQGDWTENDSCY